MAARRDHEFTGVDLGRAPTFDELVELIDRIDGDFEAQRQRLLQLYVWFEAAVTEQVRAEQRGDLASREVELLRLQLTATERELEAVRGTKLFRIARPLRTLYTRLRSVRD